jgi:hypothetical protein
VSEKETRYYHLCAAHGVEECVPYGMKLPSDWKTASPRYPCLDHGWSKDRCGFHCGCGFSTQFCRRTLQFIMPFGQFKSYRAAFNARLRSLRMSPFAKDRRPLVKLIPDNAHMTGLL